MCPSLAAQYSPRQTATSPHTTLPRQSSILLGIVSTVFSTPTGLATYSGSTVAKVALNPTLAIKSSLYGTLCVKVYRLGKSPPRTCRVKLEWSFGFYIQQHMDLPGTVILGMSLDADRITRLEIDGSQQCI